MNELFDWHYMLAHIGWLPALVVLFRLAYRERNPVFAAAVSYFFGCIGTIIALAMQAVWHDYMPQSPVLDAVGLILYRIPVEEWTKIVAALLAARVLQIPLNRISFIPIAVSSSLGFAATETALYVTEFGLDLLPVRVLLSIPAHISFTLFTAIGIATAKDAEMTKRTVWGWWLLSLFAHVSYNVMLLLTPSSTIIVPFSLVGVLYAGAISIAVIRFKKPRLKGR